MMTHNYLFRSRKSVHIYIKFMIAMQISGTLLFIALALTLTSLGLPQNKTIIVVFLTLTFLTIAASYYVHKNDLNLLRSRIWPIDGPEDVLKRLLGILPSIERNVIELEKLRRRVEDLLIQNCTIRKRANSVQATSSIPEIMHINKKILEIRADINSDLRKSKNTHDDIVRYIQSLEQNHSFSISHPELKLIGQRVTSMQASVRTLRQTESVISRKQVDILHKVGAT